MDELESSVVAPDANVESNVESSVSENAENLNQSLSDNSGSENFHNTNSGEKTFTQEEVNKLIGSVKNKEREKLRNAEYSHGSRSTEEAPRSVESNFDIGSEVNKVLQKKQEELEAQKAYEAAQGIINNLSDKIVSGKAKYEDFDEKLSYVNLENPDLVMSLNDLDNPADVLYALGEDPTTYLEVVNGLSSPYTSRAALAKISKIASAIKNNEEARAIHNKGSVPSKIKSSPMNTGNSRPSHSEMLKNKDYMF
jgi:hypothetical protein